MILIFSSYGFQITHSIYNNDWLHNLDQGLNIHSSHPLIQSFKTAAIHNCHAFAYSKAELTNCINYQNVIEQNAYMSHPIYGIYGSSISSIDLDQNPLAIAKQIQDVIVKAGIVNVMFLSLLIFYCSIILEYKYFFPMAMTLSIVFLSSHLEVGFLRNFSGGLKNLNWFLPIACLIISLLFWKTNDTKFFHLATSIQDRIFTNNLSHRIDKLIKFALILIISLSFTWIFFFQNAEIANDAVIILGLFFIIFFGLSSRVSIYLLSLILLCLVISTSVLPSSAVFPRHLCAIWIAICLYAARTFPAKILIFLMPISLIFHIGTGIVISACLFATEIFIFIIIRKTSVILFSSLLTFIIGYLFTSFFWESGLHSGEKLLIDHLFLFIQSSISFILVIIFCIFLLWIAVRLMLDEKRRDLDLTRCLILTALFLFSVQIAESTKTLYGLEFDIQPGYFLLYRLPDYLGPALSISILLYLLKYVIMNNLFNNLASRNFIGAFSPKILVMMCFICFFPINPIDLNLRKFVISVENFYKYLKGSEIEHRFRNMTLAYDFRDDIYFLPSSATPNSPITYYSLLKLKLRIAQNEAKKIEIKNLKNE